MEYKNYNRLSEDYNQLYLENIEAFQHAINMMCYELADYLDFYPSFGLNKNEEVEFLVYGQAVNSWNTGFRSGDVITQEKVHQSMSVFQPYAARSSGLST